MGIRTVNLTPSPSGTCRIYAALLMNAMFQPNKAKRDKIILEVHNDLMRLASALDGIKSYDELDALRLHEQKHCPVTVCEFCREYLDLHKEEE